MAVEIVLRAEAHDPDNTASISIKLIDFENYYPKIVLRLRVTQ